ncbi:MAG: hypothetical protein LRZ88_10110 [Candidatus Cloacimonetes bacterium]|nr:hypothetical protein [Candidatus Cloacimonadota bacterium]
MKKYRKISKLIVQMVLIGLTIGSVYYFMDLRTELFRDPQGEPRFSTHESVFTTEPLREAAPRSPDPKWGGKVSGQLFLGFIPGYVLFMAVLIFFVLAQAF